MVYVKNINRNIPTTRRRARGDCETTLTQQLIVRSSGEPTEHSVVQRSHNYGFLRTPQSHQKPSTEQISLVISSMSKNYYLILCAVTIVTTPSLRSCSSASSNQAASDGCQYRLICVVFHIFTSAVCHCNKRIDSYMDTEQIT